MEIILLIAALVCAAACTASGAALWLCLRSLERSQAAETPATPELSEEEGRERALREQRRFEEALAGILSYGRADMCRRPGEEG